MPHPPWIDSIEDRATRQEALFDWNERAAVMEYDGGLERDEAERLASELVRKRYGK